MITLSLFVLKKEGLGWLGVTGRVYFSVFGAGDVKASLAPLDLAILAQAPDRRAHLHLDVAVDMKHRISQTRTFGRKSAARVAMLKSSALLSPHRTAMSLPGRW